MATLAPASGVTAAGSPPPAARSRQFTTLNGVRAIAAYTVIATHVGFNTGRALDDGPFAPLLARLDYGVTLFFLLSGFLLSRQFLLDGAAELSRAGVLQFWRRRALRVLPAYWISVSVVLALLSSSHVTGGDWLSYLTLTQTYDHHAGNESLTQMWTLAVEVSFYAVLPLLVLASRRIRVARQTQAGLLVAGMTAAALVANLVAHHVDHGSDPALLWLPFSLDWFALGVLLASLSVDAAAPARWQRAPVRWARSAGTCWVLGALLFWLSTLPIGGPRDLAPATTWEWTTKHYLYGGSAFFFLLPLVLGTAPWAEQLLGNRVMHWLGEISYGVYLWHLGLLFAIQRAMGWQQFGGHFAGLYVLTAAAATATAATSWHLVERPLLRRFSSSWRRVPRQRDRAQGDPQRQQADQLHPG